MADLQKYFLAILPPPEFGLQVHSLKLQLRDEFGVKYALKSPPHITMKMPFLYNSAKEHNLIKSLREFSSTIMPFELRIERVGHFRNRVIFLDVQPCKALTNLQSDLGVHCRGKLKLNLELSDTNYHPHLTVAFQDVKKHQFEAVRDRVLEASLKVGFEVKSYFLLKRAKGVWEPHAEIFLRKNDQLAEN